MQTFTLHVVIGNLAIEAADNVQVPHKSATAAKGGFTVVPSLLLVSNNWSDRRRT